jgi:small subunit ribosomal protein S15
LSRRIDDLATHLKKNPKDNHSRRGLLQMVSDRKAHMKYLEKKNPRRYGALTKKLGLKK